MQPKSAVIMSGGLTNSYTNSQTFTVLGYAKTLITLKNMGGGSGITYQVQANPNINDTLAPWLTLLSGTTITSGTVVTHKVTDPWYAVRVQAKNTQSNWSGSVIVWVNGDPR